MASLTTAGWLGVKLSDGTEYRYGLHVRCNSDERHVGQCERITASGSIIVRWPSNIIGYYRPEELNKAPAEQIGFN